MLRQLFSHLYHNTYGLVCITFSFITRFLNVKQMNYIMNLKESKEQFMIYGRCLFLSMIIKE
ncbi:hypothetical protein FJP86_07305 [Bacillus velezensis]|nr:hypothetical protein [Bacillus velezensis]QBK79537.1 hypothetical protein EYS44_07455 [Bacillus velezensis]QEQ51701.1 hypothetical protein FNS63_01615 [Bacillus amyloliquefaciens]TNU85110.1 hypothetical protein FIA57_07095 [Bacillus velezensis]